MCFSLPHPDRVYRAALASEGAHPSSPLAEALELARGAKATAVQASVRGERSQRWLDLLVGAWRWSDHINLGEMRAAVMWGQVLAREPTSAERRVVMLTDSGVVAGALTKGRSGSWALNRLLRVRAALEAAGAYRLIPRWVPTHLMPADRLSRTRKVCGMCVGYFKCFVKRGQKNKG